MKSNPFSKKFHVGPEDHGITLLQFLKKKCPDVSSVKSLKRAIEGRECLVNGKVEFFSSYKLIKGDVVELRTLFATGNTQSSCEIVYEDLDLIVINKPAGVVSDAEGIKQKMQISSNVSLIHRLDKDTSGLLMLAKNSKILQSMKELFSKKEVQKFYLALVDGSLSKKSGVIDNFLGKKGSYQGQTIYGQVPEGQGERAVTHWRLLEKGLRCALMFLEPKTGRTHQLRVHLKEIGHPILGDYQYSKNFSCPIQPSRQMLHALGLYFIHPVTKKNVILSAPLPEDFIMLAEQIKLSLHTVSDPNFLNDLIQLQKK
jgi:RluA family pseudouridine synthase